jgi:hypothetical protein
MQGSSASINMHGFDFTDTWSTVEGDYPELQADDNEGTSVPSILMNGDGSSSSPYEISTASDLQAMQKDLSANYIVVNDINASGTVNWNNGQGFNPVGTYVWGQDNTEFTGSFDGQNHTISNLYINRLDDSQVGLFGRISAGVEVKNVGVINVNITGEGSVGGLVASNYGNISNSYSTGNVTGEEYVGGLVGYNDNFDNKGNIWNSYSTVNVTGELRYIGGLVGYNDRGNISNSYSTGNVNYIESDYAGEEEVGGLVGRNHGSVSDSYWDIESTGQSSSEGGNGLTTIEMQGSSAEGNMDAFDFTSTWSTVEGDYPELQWQE